MIFNDNNFWTEKKQIKNHLLFPFQNCSSLRLFTKHFVIIIYCREKKMSKNVEKNILFKANLSVPKKCATKKIFPFPRARSPPLCAKIKCWNSLCSIGKKKSFLLFQHHLFVVFFSFPLFSLLYLLYYSLTLLKHCISDHTKTTTLI